MIIWPGRWIHWITHGIVYHETCLSYKNYLTIATQNPRKGQTIGIFVVSCTRGFGSLHYFTILIIFKSDNLTTFQVGMRFSCDDNDSLLFMWSSHLTSSVFPLSHPSIILRKLNYRTCVNSNTQKQRKDFITIKINNYVFVSANVNCRLREGRIRTKSKCVSNIIFGWALYSLLWAWVPLEKDLRMSRRDSITILCLRHPSPVKESLRDDTMRMLRRIASCSMFV